MHDEPDRLAARLEALADRVERLGLSEYARYLDDPRRLLWRNFLAGAARGVGLALGFTVLGAALTALLQRLLVRSMPGIGTFLADMVRIIQAKL